MLPFTFADNAAVFAALDGALGEVIRRELAAAGLHGFRHCWLNGFHHITTSNRPVHDAEEARHPADRGGEQHDDRERDQGAPEDLQVAGELVPDHGGSYFVP